MKGQMVLCGCEEFFKPDWNPQPHTLARVKAYLEGFASNGREIYARRKHIAGKLGMAVRTLARYLAHLKAEGWLKTVKRTCRTAIRKVVEIVCPGPSAGPSIEETPEASQTHLKQNTINPPSSVGEPDRGRSANIPVGYGEQFAEYVGIFDRVPKPRNDHDLKRAHAAWIGIGPDQWPAAIADARRLAREIRCARFMPSMVNHLLDQPWTRVVVTAAPVGMCDNGWAWNDPRWSELGD